MANSLFSVLTVRSAGTTAQWNLYPLLSPKRKEIIAWEEQDGQMPLRRNCRASGVTVSRIINGAERPIISLRHLRINVYVTEGRLVLACKRYRTSTAWAVAGPGTGFAAGGITTARTSRRRHGSALVGHIRYPWVRSISPQPRRWYGRDRLIIEYSIAPRIPMLLRLDLTRRLWPWRWSEPNANLLARDICALVARWRQDYDTHRSQAEDHDLDQLVHSAAYNPIVPDPGKAEAYELPYWFDVSANVPYLRRSRTPRRPDVGDDI
jgi:hypothetical protein